MDMNVSKEWLLRMAEAEGNGITSVGGFVVELGLPVHTKGDAMERLSDEQLADIEERIKTGRPRPWGPGLFSALLADRAEWKAEAATLRAEVDRLRTEVERLKILADETRYEQMAEDADRAMFAHLMAVGRPLPPHANFGDGMDRLPDELARMRAEVDRLRAIVSAADAEHAVYRRLTDLADDSMHAHFDAIGRPMDKATCYGEAARELPVELARMRAEVDRLRAALVHVADIVHLADFDRGDRLAESVVAVVTRMDDDLMNLCEMNNNGMAKLARTEAELGRLRGVVDALARVVVEDIVPINKQFYRDDEWRVVALAREALAALDAPPPLGPAPCEPEPAPRPSADRLAEACRKVIARLQSGIAAEMENDGDADLLTGFYGSLVDQLTAALAEHDAGRAGDGPWAAEAERLRAIIRDLIYAIDHVDCRLPTDEVLYRLVEAARSAESILADIEPPDPSPTALADSPESLCREWNAKHPVGTRVRVRERWFADGAPYDQFAAETLTTGWAIVAGGRATIGVASQYGPVDLADVEPLPRPAATPEDQR